MIASTSNNLSGATRVPGRGRAWRQVTAGEVPLGPADRAEAPRAALVRGQRWVRRVARGQAGGGGSGGRRWVRRAALGQAVAAAVQATAVISTGPGGSASRQRSRKALAWTAGREAR